MKTKIYIPIIALLLIIDIGLIIKLNRSTYLLNKLEGTITNSDRYTILKNQVMLQYKYDNSQIKDFEVTDINNNKTMFSSLLKNGDKEKLILKISAKNCSPCIEKELANSTKIAKTIGINNIIILAEYSSIRELKAYFNCENLNIYLIDENCLNNILIDENIPFIFITTTELFIKDLLIPAKELQNYSKSYYSVIQNKYWANKRPNKTD